MAVLDFGAFWEHGGPSSDQYNSIIESQRAIFESVKDIETKAVLDDICNNYTSLLNDIAANGNLDTANDDTIDFLNAVFKDMLENTKKSMSLEEIQFNLVGSKTGATFASSHNLSINKIVSDLENLLQTWRSFLDGKPINADSDPRVKTINKSAKSLSKLIKNIKKMNEEDLKILQVPKKAYYVPNVGLTAKSRNKNPDDNVSLIYVINQYLALAGAKKVNSDLRGKINEFGLTRYLQSFYENAAKEITIENAKQMGTQATDLPITVKLPEGISKKDLIELKPTVMSVDDGNISGQIEIGLKQVSQKADLVFDIAINNIVNNQASRINASLKSYGSPYNIAIQGKESGTYQFLFFGPELVKDDFLQIYLRGLYHNGPGGNENAESTVFNSDWTKIINITKKIMAFYGTFGTSKDLSANANTFILNDIGSRKVNYITAKEVANIIFASADEATLNPYYTITGDFPNNPYAYADLQTKKDMIKSFLGLKVSIVMKNFYELFRASRK